MRELGEEGGRRGRGRRRGRKKHRLQMCEAAIRNLSFKWRKMSVNREMIRADNCSTEATLIISTSLIIFWL